MPRKAFAYVACRIYQTPVSRVCEFLGVGGAAVSAMAAAGKIYKRTYISMTMKPERPFQGILFLKKLSKRINGFIVESIPLIIY